MKTGEVEFCPLQFEHFPSATVHLFALPTTIAGPSFTLPFFITNFGELAEPMFFLLSLFSLCLSLFVIFFSYTVFTQPLLFSLQPYFYSSFLSVSISTLSPISTYLSQFCQEEEVYHFIPILNKIEDVFLENIKYSFMMCINNALLISCGGRGLLWKLINLPGLF